MFGASEDRARQLAYRKRRERVISGSTCSVYRSLSFANCTSQHAHISSTPKEGPPQTLGHAEHLPLQTGLLNNGNIPTNRDESYQSTAAALLAADAQQSQMERHRLQAEYLSQVLYSTLSFTTTGRGPCAVPASKSHLSRDGTPGQSIATRHIRSITAPVASADRPSLFGSAVQSHVDVSALPLLHRTMFNDRFRMQTAVSLRGGGDAYSFHRSMPPQSRQPIQALQTQQQIQTQRQAPTHAQIQAHMWAQRQAQAESLLAQYHTPIRQYLSIFLWAPQYINHPAFLVPISCGTQYDVFIGELLQGRANYFLDLFGPLRLPNHYASPTANMRRKFYRKLDEETKLKFQEMIEARGRELRNIIQDGITDRQLSSQSQPARCVMLYHLMEAMEDIFVPKPSLFQNEADYTKYMKWTLSPEKNILKRTSSAPSLGQQLGPTGYLALSICFYQ
jgi:hypothetical protein